MRRKRPLILLVDGDLIRAQRVAMKLAHLDYEVQIVDNGADGLLKAHEVCPDAVIAASAAPVLNGYLLVQALRDERRTCEIPAILITDGANPEDLARGWRAGADLCIPQSQGEPDLLATLNRALDSVRPKCPAPCGASMVS